MLIEDLRLEPAYDIQRLEKARKGLARNSDDFYTTNGRLEILIKLMSEEPSSPRINDIVASLPWKARTYITSSIIKVMPDGMPNLAYRPKKAKTNEPEKFRYVGQVSEQRVNNTRRTQVATTGGTYEKTGIYLRDKLPPNSKIISIGAGLDHTKPAIARGLGGRHGHEIHDHEPHPEGRKSPPEFTDAAKIPKNRYNAAVSHNVLNVVEPAVRDQVMKSILDSVAVGGHAIIGTRKWTGDIALNRNFEPGDEPKSMWVKKAGGEMSYQKGFDGDELKDYVEDYARRHGYGVTVRRLSGIAANAVHVTVDAKPKRHRK